MGVTTRIRKVKFSAQVKKYRASELEPIVQKKYGCTTSGLVARIFSTCSHFRDGVIGRERGLSLRIFQENGKIVCAMVDHHSGLINSDG